MKAAHIASTFELVAFHTATGSINAAPRDPTDTRLHKHINIIKVSRAKKHAIGEIIMKHPAAVATPFPPPLNFRKTGKRCPNKAETAIMDIYISAQKPLTPVNLIARYTGNAPLNTSPARVIIPSLFPAILLTFVAPMLPLPFCLISRVVNNFVKIKPQGTEPSIYAKITSAGNFNIFTRSIINYL